MAGYRGRVNRHLNLRGKTYWFKMAIPVDCRPHFGGTGAYVQSTGTGDITKARDKRDMIERELQDTFKRIKRGEVQSDAERKIEQFAVLSRQAFNATEDTDERALIVDTTHDYAETLPPQQRKAFDAAWAGREATDKYVDAWLKEARLSDKTTKEWRGLVLRFTRWCTSKGYRLTDINRRTAGQYVSDELSPMNRKTAKKHLSAVKGYWDYLIRRGLVDTELSGNPWTNQLQPETRKQGSKTSLEVERAFTDDELSQVLYGDTEAIHSEQLKELALISVLSGMRLSEITDLTVAACQNDIFDLSKAKTQAGVRVIPIHSSINKMIKTRMEGKQPDDMLFHEFVEMPNPSDTLSKAFTRRRVKLGVDEKKEGKRRSLVNFHSFRRTFITKARHAGYPETTIADIVGHDQGKKTMTFGVYTQGASLEQKQECVAAVTVPTAP